MTVELGVAMPLMILGWALVIFIGGIVAFSVYAILAGNREEKQYKTSTLPAAEMIQGLKLDAEAADTDGDTLESIDLDSLPSNAPLHTPVPTGAGPVMPGPALDGPMPTPAASPLTQPGDSVMGVPGYEPPAPQMAAMPAPPMPASMPAMGMDQLAGSPGTGDSMPMTPWSGERGTASPESSPLPPVSGDGGILSRLDGMIDSNGSGTSAAQAPVNPFSGR